MFNTISSHALEFLFLSTEGAPLQTKMLLHIRWHAPQRNWFKLNIDGAYTKQPNGTSLGGVFKDHTGKWILGFQKRCAATSPLHVELQAIYEGLQIATRFDLFPRRWK